MSSEQSNILKRQEQLTNWFESDTHKASKSIKEAKKIIFSNEVQFLSACNSNDWQEIERLLKQGIDINCTQDDGLTSLHQACIDDDEHLVKYLIDQGADIDAQDKEGWTPLFAAISCNYLSITKYLISRGARLDIVSFDGELPLDQTSNEAIALLLKEEMKKQSIDPNEIRNRERNTMLNDIEVMEKTKDFSKFTLADNGGSLLHIAASKDYTDVLERLLDIINPELLNHVDKDGWNALHVAAHWGNKKACVLLVDADIDFEQLTANNQTILEVSDDNAKPYIREEIRKARFRRQDRNTTIKRPVTSPNTDYKPSETKIVCQDKKLLPADLLPEDNTSQQTHPDNHLVVSKEFVSSLPCDNGSSMSTATLVVAESPKAVDVDLKINTKEGATYLEERSVTSLIDSDIKISESVPGLPLEDSNITVTNDDSKPIASSDSNPINPIVHVLPPVKAVESESQRKDKARHVRSTRRLTQGVTAEEIDEAKKLSSIADRHDASEKSSIESKSSINSVSAISNHIDNNKAEEQSESSVDISLPQVPDLSINGNTPQIILTDLSDTVISVSNIESLDTAEIKRKAGSHILNKRKSRERLPTGMVDIKDIEAAQKELVDESQRPACVNVTAPIEPEIDYKAMYENELKEKEKLQRNLARIRRDLEQSEDKIKNLHHNHVSQITQTQGPTIITSECDLKTMERLRDENKKMKEANSALIRVISRLSHPPTTTSITSSS